MFGSPQSDWLATMLAADNQGNTLIRNLNESQELRYLCEFSDTYRIGLPLGVH